MGKAKAPQKAKEAGTAEAGEVTELVANPSQPGKFSLPQQAVETGSEDEEPPPPTEIHWVNIELRNDQDKPVYSMPSGGPVKFWVKAGGQTYEGQLNNDGKARVDGLPDAQCEICFPEIDESEWS